jgi:glycosyltransferase involved in cell wall biosynthesis
MTKVLKIGIDIRDLKIAQTGTKTYLEELCKVFKKNNNLRYKFFFFDSILPVYLGNNRLLKLIGHFNYLIWKQISLPLKAWFKGIDILFCTDAVAPYIHLGYKTVPVFHDAFFFETPEHFNKIWLKITTLTAVAAAKRSPIVVTPSLYARQQINFYTQIPLAKMPVIYEGPKSLISNTNYSESDIAAKYILHVGVMNKRKNIPALIYAFKKLKEKGYTDLKLVLAGKIETKNFTTNYDEIKKAVKDSALENDIIFTGYISDEKLQSLYNKAFMYVFPSLNEGFGIPILEAFNHNLPVLVADNTCLPEIGGEAVVTFNPLNIDDIAAKMQMILDNPELKNSLIKKGQKRLEYFSWEKTAQLLLNEFERIC